MDFNCNNIGSILIEVFGESCYGYPGSGYNMAIANRFGVFNYTEEYIKTGHITVYNGRLVLTDFDESLFSTDKRLIELTTEKELKEYLIKVNNWMAEQFRRRLPKSTSKIADSILEVLD